MHLNSQSQEASFLHRQDDDSGAMNIREYTLTPFQYKTKKLSIRQSTYAHEVGGFQTIPASTTIYACMDSQTECATYTSY